MCPKNFSYFRIDSDLSCYPNLFKKETLQAVWNIFYILRCLIERWRRLLNFGFLSDQDGAY